MLLIPVSISKSALTGAFLKKSKTLLGLVIIFLIFYFEDCFYYFCINYEIGMNIYF